MRVGELEHETRLADAGLADHGHDLAPSGAGSLQRSAQLLELGAPADEASEAADRGHLKTRPAR